MPAPTRPTTFLNWTPAQNPADVQQPTTGQATTGWAKGQKAPRQFENYINNLFDRWVMWLDYITQNAVLPATTQILQTTGNTTNGSRVISSLASTTNLQAGSAVAGTGISSGTYVLEVFGSTAVLSKPATATASGVTLTFSHEYAGGATVQAQLDELDAAVSRNRPYDIVVGSGNECDYATLPALAAAQVTIGPNKRILLIESQTLATTIAFTQQFWHFTAIPGISLMDGGAGTAISIAGQGCEFERMRFVNFTTALQFLVSGVNGRVLNNWYNNVTTEVDDSAVTSANHKPVDFGGFTE